MIGLHASGDPPDMVADFQEQTGVTFKLQPDVDYSLGAFTFPPGVNFPYPRDVVIGPDLTIHSIKNSFDADEMDVLIQDLLTQIQ